MRNLRVFNEPKNVAVITTKHVVQGKKPILRVFHDGEDGMWQFLSIDEVTIEDAIILALEEVFNIDNTISEVADLPLGWVAWRQAKGKPWEKKLQE